MALTLGTNSGFVTSAPSGDPGATTIQIDNYGFVTKHTLPADATTITEMGWWCVSVSEAANWRAALYDNDGAVVPGEAGTRRFLSSDAAKGTTSGWKVISGLTWDVSAYAGTALWLSIGLDDTASTTNSQNVTTGGSGFDRLSGAAALPDPFGGGAIALGSGMAAIYAVYTTGGATPTPSTGRLVGTDLPIVGASPSTRLVVS